MGHIKEPDGIDFIIKSRPLTTAEEQAISEHIRLYKLKYKTTIVNTTIKKKVKKKVSKVLA
jgi:hypothetical protein